jgi:hypothetical protein
VSRRRAQLPAPGSSITGRRRSSSLPRTGIQSPPNLAAGGSLTWAWMMSPKPCGLADDTTRCAEALAWRPWPTPTGSPSWSLATPSPAIQRRGFVAQVEQGIAPANPVVWPYSCRSGIPAFLQCPRFNSSGHGVAAWQRHVKQTPRGILDLDPGTDYSSGSGLGVPAGPSFRLVRAAGQAQQGSVRRLSVVGLLRVAAVTP